MKIFKIIYYFFCAAILLVALLFIISVFPIPGNYKIMTVLTGSMEPKIKTGSVVIVKPVNEYKVNNVITFNTTKGKDPTTHRIADIKVSGGQINYITKGDANNAVDQNEVPKNNVVGRVLFSVPYIGYVVDFAKKPIGFSILIIIPAALIIFDEAKKIFKEISRISKLGKTKNVENEKKEGA